MLKKAVNSEDYEYVSDDVDSLFANITVKETIEYILHKIYVDKSIKPFRKKSIFKKLLVKLKKGCAFSVNSRLIKQIDRCPMGSPVSVVSSDIFMCKMEEDVVVPAKPIFYKRYVDDTYIRRKKNVNDELFQNLNCYHTNIKLTLEGNPRKFLDTEIIRKNNTISTQVFTKLTTFPVQWSFKIPTSYKRNAITSELHRAKISQRTLLRN